MYLSIEVINTSVTFICISFILHLYVHMRVYQYLLMYLDSENSPSYTCH